MKIKLQIILILLGMFFLSNCVSQRNFIKQQHNETYENKSVKIIKTAESLLNISKKKFDCSKFVQYVYSLEGINLPRSSIEQFQIGEKISHNNLKKADLVFFTTIRKDVSHVGIYIENNNFIHVSTKKNKVIIDNLLAPYYQKRFIEGRRVIK
ncbi:MAG: C40 family peptidase [bacterium]